MKLIKSISSAFFSISILAFSAIGFVFPLASAAPKPEDIIRDMKRVADWQLANPSKYGTDDWTQSPFYLGLLDLHQVTGEDKYLKAVEGFGGKIGFKGGHDLTHADHHAVLQAWLELYRKDKDEAKLAPSIERFNKVAAHLAKAEPKSISGGSFTWCWCDALYMSPPVWARLSAITGDSKYLEWADREWWTTTDMLYNPQHHLYYRDNRYFDSRSHTGKSVFWSRGNGWVIGGLTAMLDYIPVSHPSHERYLGLYRDMMYALLDLQGADGLWRTSLLDPKDPKGESSGTSFFVLGMAWGINRNLLPEDKFSPAMMKGYEALAKNIQPTGMMGFVQKIGEAPDNMETTAESTEVYGSGAFLQAGSEIVRLLDPTKRRKDLVSLKGVKLPAGFMPAKPRTHARFVPERADDFAWENDLVAFRTYGPALRASKEDSGIDCWFKRVPYPIVDKWYMEELKKSKYGNINKSYHKDQGEGLDVYKVGDTRGCGGISVWADGKLHNSNTFVGHRIIESTPERSAFELHYASDMNGKVLRETKRITIIMGQHFYQCDSLFTLDGKPAELDVAIGLTHQAKGSKPAVDASTGTIELWEKMGDLSVGTAIVIDPKRMVKHEELSQGDQVQSLCLARTDAKGHIRWFAGFGWEGQGIITNADQWADQVKKFANKFATKPFADHSKDANFQVHNLPVPSN